MVNIQSSVQETPGLDSLEPRTRWQCRRRAWDLDLFEYSVSFKIYILLKDF
jgi:hypothetical protein